jgi:CrcB protein
MSELSGPIDPDIDLATSENRSQAPVLAAISAGGVLGALARYGLASAWPHAPGTFPWATLVINVSGCLLIGVLMVVVTEVLTEQRLIRPFLGVGVLGGYTTFSTYIVDIGRAASAGAAGIALAYLVGTLIGALLAVWVGASLTEWWVRSRRR